MKNLSSRQKIGLIGLIVIAISIGIVVYQNRPLLVVYQYVQAINKEDFNKAYELLYVDDIVATSGKEEVIACMVDYYTQPQLEKLQLNSVKAMKYKENEEMEACYFDVSYVFKNQSIRPGVSVVKASEGWQVRFPFKTSDVMIEAPVGTEVYFDGKEVVKGASGYEIEQVLPGDYVVTMRFYKGLKDTYVTAVSVPQQTLVQTPYATADVVVEAPDQTLVELAGQQMLSVGGHVRFENLLPGTYTLGVIDPHGHRETWVEEVILEEGLQTVAVDALLLSTEGRDKLMATLNAFYTQYEQAMVTQDTMGIEAYLGESKEHVVDIFDAWFIEGKAVQQAVLNVEVETFEVLDDGVIQVETLEEVEMVNDTLLGDETYKIVLRSMLVWEPVGESFIIQDKIITESMIAYKDSDGKWIAY